jgi:hypothetical protein
LREHPSSSLRGFTCWRRRGVAKRSRGRGEASGEGL